jgi:hypothetical protein
LRNLHHQKVKLYNIKTRNVIREFVAKRPELKKDALLWEATRRFGELYEEMCMRWLRETVRIVDEKF